MSYLSSLRHAGEVLYTYLTEGRQAAYDAATVYKGQISYYSASLADKQLGACAQAVAAQDILPAQVVGIIPRTIYWVADKPLGNTIWAKVGELTADELKQCTVSLKGSCCAYESMKRVFFRIGENREGFPNALLGSVTEKFPKKVFTVIARGHHFAETSFETFKTVVFAKNDPMIRCILIGSTGMALYSAKQVYNNVVALSQAQNMTQVAGKVVKAAAWTLAAAVGTAISYSTAIDTLT